jgi:nucleotide-binding universal stress UspA family protein
MKILVAVDGSPYTKRMLAYLAAHDEWLGQHHEYSLIHAVTPVPGRAAAALEAGVLHDYYEDEAQKVFAPLRPFFEKQSLKAEFHHKVGHAAEVIAQAASHGSFDLLMMGSHGHGTLGHLVMGSVVTKVMAHCTTPMLLIR